MNENYVMLLKEIKNLRQSMERRFDDMERRFDDMERRVTNVENRLDKVETRISELDNKIIETRRVVDYLILSDYVRDDIEEVTIDLVPGGIPGPKIDPTGRYYYGL